MSQKTTDFKRALLGLLSAVLYVILFLLGFITCFMGIIMFVVGNIGPHNGKYDLAAVILVGLLIEGAGVLMLYLAGRVIGKGRPPSNIAFQDCERAKS